MQAPAPAGWVVTFLAVSFAWIFFRGSSMEHAFGMIGGLVGLNGLHSDQLSSVFGRGEALVLGLALAVALLMPNTQQLIDEGAGRAAAGGR